MNLAERFFVKTAAYRAVIRDRQNDALSHAYLLTCSDEAWLRLYVRALAKAIMCEKGDLCGECRPCHLIDKEAYADCEFYPDEDGKITSEGITEIVSEKCFVKPLESFVRVFAIVGAEKMNASAQNKLLKTLEEPPKNVCIILGATTDYPLLPTVKSRVKRLEIPTFSTADIIDVFSGRLADKERLKTAAELCDGKPGAIEGIYNDDSALKSVDECISILTNMKKSRDIAGFSSNLIKKTREQFTSFLLAMRLVVRDVLYVQEGLGSSVINSGRIADIERIADRYNEGALLTVCDVIDRSLASLSYYTNQTMLADGLLFALLEENYRWQKL